MFRQFLLTNTWSRLTGSCLANSNLIVCVKWSRHIASINLLQTAANNKERTFKDLFKTSKFVGMVNPVGKIVDGRIIATVDDKLYVDFGGKFHGVVDRPTDSADRYVKGAKVDVLINDLEIGMHFLGSNKDTSLLEASIELVGLA